MIKKFTKRGYALEARKISLKCLGKEFCLACVERVLELAYVSGKRDGMNYKRSE